ncbi:MAG: carboxylating nicotinate-nucleotide diphosphorylase [Firmicutes bacterium]|jgi:nicotinate-nucleotide pyrophosphorylase (carboxylating)|nr:carboxylating nicotinate-nucleotide diphosphorylase [Bacillota bacterium]
MLSIFMLRDIITRSLKEDIGSGDLTTQYAVPPEASGEARIFAKQKGVICGLPVAEAVFEVLDPQVQCRRLVAEGAQVEPGCPVFAVSGSLRSILTGERTALNFIQHLSGIATKTAAWVKELEAYPVRLADTRKTTPGLRLLEKYAVLTGGACNHRLALDGGILIKENHIRAAGGISAAVQAIREKAPFTLRIEIEVTTLAELEEALAAQPDLILLDNMDVEMMRRAVEITAGRTLLEASGNITFERLREVAATGVDYISSGALTHSFKSLDLSLLIS